MSKTTFEQTPIVASSEQVATEEITRKLLELLPTDYKDRADNISSFDGGDWDTFIGIVHMYVAPASDPEHTQRQMYVKNPDGSSRKALMSSEERRPYFERSIDKIMRYTKKSDWHMYPQEHLIRVAFAIAMMIVEAHPYEDGNGRTARTIAHLICGAPEDTKLLAELYLNRYSDDSSLSHGTKLNSYKRLDTCELSPDEIIDYILAENLPLYKLTEYNKRVGGSIWHPVTYKS